MISAAIVLGPDLVRRVPSKLLLVDRINLKVELRALAPGRWRRKRPTVTRFTRPCETRKGDPEIRLVRRIRAARALVPSSVCKGPVASLKTWPLPSLHHLLPPPPLPRTMSTSLRPIKGWAQVLSALYLSSQKASQLTPVTVNPFMCCVREWLLLLLACIGGSLCNPCFG